MDHVQPEDAERAETIERPDPARLRYWARLIKLLREPWPPRSLMPTRSPEPPRLPESPRPPVPARLGDDA
jgi:hypothetical protein